MQFVVGGKGKKELVAMDWKFNAWGGKGQREEIQNPLNRRGGKCLEWSGARLRSVNVYEHLRNKKNLQAFTFRLLTDC